MCIYMKYIISSLFFAAVYIYFAEFAAFFLNLNYNNVLYL